MRAALALLLLCSMPALALEDTPDFSGEPPESPKDSPDVRPGALKFYCRGQMTEMVDGRFRSRKTWDYYLVVTRGDRVFAWADKFPTRGAFNADAAVKTWHQIGRSQDKGALIYLTRLDAERMIILRLDTETGNLLSYSNNRVTRVSSESEAKCRQIPMLTIGQDEMGKGIK